VQEGSLNRVGFEQTIRHGSRAQEFCSQAQSGSLESEQTRAEVGTRCDVCDFVPNDSGLDYRQDVYPSLCYPIYQIGHGFQHHNISGFCDPPSESQPDDLRFLFHQSTNDAGALAGAFDPYTQAWSSSLEVPLSNDIYEPTLSVGPWDYLSESPLAKSGSFELPEGMHGDWTSSLTNGLCSTKASQDSATPSDNLSATPCS
jgi:hypothetical protein